MSTSTIDLKNHCLGALKINHNTIELFNGGNNKDSTAKINIESQLNKFFMTDQQTDNIIMAKLSFNDLLSIPIEIFGAPEGLLYSHFFFS